MLRKVPVNKIKVRNRSPRARKKDILLKIAISKTRLESRILIFRIFKKKTFNGAKTSSTAVITKTPNFKREIGDNVRKRSLEGEVKRSTKIIIRYAPIPQDK